LARYLTTILAPHTSFCPLIRRWSSALRKQYTLNLKQTPHTMLTLVLFMTIADTLRCRSAASISGVGKSTSLYFGHWRMPTVSSVTGTELSTVIPTPGHASVHVLVHTCYLPTCWCTCVTYPRHCPFYAVLGSPVGGLMSLAMHRWGDGPVHLLAVAALLGKQGTVMLPNVSYWHQNFVRIWEG
jgi:hypothetical protein